MGLLKNARLAAAAEAAAEAGQAGRQVLVYRQNIPLSRSGWSGEIPDIGEVIEMIERYDWRLDQMAFDSHTSNGGCIMIFRRPRA